MIVVIAKLKAKTGQEQRVEQALRDILPKVRAEEGTLEYTLCRAQNDPSTVMVLEKYRDMEAFLAHGSTPYLAEMFEVVTPLLDGDLSVEMFDVLDAAEH